MRFSESSTAMTRFPPCGGAGPATLAFLLAIALLVPGPLRAQLASMRGRVMDAATGEGVRDATVEMTGGSAQTSRAVVTDRVGLFRFPELEPGVYRVRVRHLAYGDHVDSIQVGAEGAVALRVLLSMEAIELDPVVVEVFSEEEMDARTRGTMIQEVTREEVQAASRTSTHLGDVLRQTIPGIRVFDNPYLPGSRLCIEFRGRRSLRYASECQTPLVFLDGVRLHDPTLYYNTIDLATIERIEVISPAEAGLYYGSESAFGVLLIETRVWLEREEREALPASLRGGVYDWSLELRSHATARVYLASALGNALGLALGLAVASRCVEFDDVARNVLNTRCGGWSTAGARAAALSLPTLGAAMGARMAGSTSLSRGAFLPALAAGTLSLLPGYAMVAAGQADADSPSTLAGQVILALGVPLTVTVADRLFRRHRRH